MNPELIADEKVEAASGTAARVEAELARGGFVELAGERFYRIEQVDAMAPFLVNLVSAGDQWMFVASNGALTAGRRDADNALFPYVTQDKLFDSAGVTGSVSLLWVEGEGEAGRLWEPLAGRAERGSRRSLYKNMLGTKIVFEEASGELGLVFRYQLSFSGRYGMVRQTTVANQGSGVVRVRALDGVQNLLPYGLDQAFVNHFSNLADAYKKSELLEGEGVGIYYLSSIPTDRAEPSEGLRATVVWSPEADGEVTLLCGEQVGAFRRGQELRGESDCRGRRGAYLVEKRFELKPGAERSWRIVADVSQDAGQIERLREEIASGVDLASRVDADVERNGRDLRRRVASADGLQRSASVLQDARHFSNILFNIMRGGVFPQGYRIETADFARYLMASNREVGEGFAAEIAGWGESIALERMMERVAGVGDDRFARLAREYLPLTFSRRHGDPSRPWNRFSIRTQDESGRPVLGYQGNWRDIFQNWEPLGYSFPGYIEGMILRFLNASTADGYNPYRLMREGFDWETIEPDEPWSNIGYWGDHQIVYLLKLLEAAERFHPGLLGGKLGEAIFVYANVPYRIRSFEALVANPRSSVDYDDVAAERIAERTRALGADGKLLCDDEGTIVTASLAEKLLVPLLAKLSNFVPDGGIWMNTQRPEWNDANNALVGNGISVVTLCYMHRYIQFLSALLDGVDVAGGGLRISRQVAALLESQRGVFAAFRGQVVEEFGARERFAMMRALGEGGAAYRSELYERGLDGERVEIGVASLRAFLDLVQSYVVASIDTNRRADCLYHSYNLLVLDRAAGEARVERLAEMLEGQVAALSSGRLSGAAAQALMASLRRSALYRDDVRSYTLYPDRELPRFLEKNRVDEDAAREIPAMAAMLDAGDVRVVMVDVAGNCRFSGGFRNSGDVRASLLRIQKEGRYGDLDAQAVEAIAALFEAAFEHHRFTGRSGTFFAYEGLGSVYWHMVSKLILALQENCLKLSSSDDAEDQRAFGALELAYYETLDGLGLEKSPSAYGAFPLDAYSHTPAHAGAQQPGMTGQVKEDILSRWGQLGLQVENGAIVFRPCLLRRELFLGEPAEFEYIDALGEERSVRLESGQLALTFGQTLFVVELGAKEGVEVEFADGTRAERDEGRLTLEESRSVFRRDGGLKRVTFRVVGPLGE